MFESQRDAEMRLNNSIIQGPEGAIYITGILDKDYFIYREITKDGLTEGQDKKGDIRDGKFNMAAFPLGYVNFNGKAFYLQRIPTRKYKQGLCKHNAFCKTPVRDLNDVFFSPGFADMFAGSYPNLEVCTQALYDFALDGMAFGRQWAVSRGPRGALLQYKNRSVGTVEGGKPELSKRFDYLKESLEEVSHDY